jgi:hypothetical protein
MCADTENLDGRGAGEVQSRCSPSQQYAMSKLALQVKKKNLYKFCCNTKFAKLVSYLVVVAGCVKRGVEQGAGRAVGVD